MIITLCAVAAWLLGYILPDRLWPSTKYSQDVTTKGELVLGRWVAIKYSLVCGLGIGFYFVAVCFKLV